MQRAIEMADISTCIIAALPPVCKQQGSPRAIAPTVPMGANAGEPHNVEMQTTIVKAALHHLETADMPGIIKTIPIAYHAKI